MAEPQFTYNLDPVSFVTIGADGPPGERTFYLQAAKGREVVTLVVEKEQAFVLAANLQQLLGNLGHVEETDEADFAERVPHMELLQPVNAAFRVARLGLGVDAEIGRMVLIADETPDGEEGERARMVATFEQMTALAKHTLWVVGQGRPICPLCGESMEPEGHFCARKNGHPTLPED